MLALFAKIHWSSNSHEWSTPQDLYDKLNAEFSFTLDPCATPENAKCVRYFTKEADGLAQDWTGETIFMNPPYGSEIKAWMLKAHEACLAGSTVVCLVPSRTDTDWWHRYAAPYEVRFIKGRLRFGGQKNCAPFPSAIVVMRPK